MDQPRTEAVEAFWKRFREASGLHHDEYAVIAFGDSPAMMDELAGLVLGGVKRATTCLERSFTEDGEMPPVVGGHVVVVDGRGRPVCIFRTTGLRTGALDSVDDGFAWDEGEGERTRAWWLAAHRSYFGREARHKGFAFDDGIATVFERFTVVWPPEVADPA
ncbi:MAG: ASCH domain-containing protein [Acetobacteraceae bacterium]|nr:ASCH domain-containing protein [Acetobacteraceae bacterium]